MTALLVVVIVVAGNLLLDLFFLLRFNVLVRIQKVPGR